MVGGRQPLLPAIMGQTDHAGAKRRFSSDILSKHSAKTPSEKKHYR